MIRLDEDALTCDFAETYNIYDFRQLPMQKVAVLAVGLRDSSRIKLKINNMTLPLNDVLLACLVDRASFLLWGHCKEGTPKPKSLLQELLKNKEDVDFEVYEMGEFERIREEIIKAKGE